MKRAIQQRVNPLHVLLMLLVFLFSGFTAATLAKAGNRNPCMVNPCGMNPCATQNPCNPCGSAPKSIRSEKAPEYRKLVALGKKIWNDPELGESGVSCMNCHEEGDKLNVEKHGGVFPHYVAMPKDTVTLDQMINYCMINPMMTQQLDPNSVEMTAIAAYYQEFVKELKKGKLRKQGNPCGQ